MARNKGYNIKGYYISLEKSFQEKIDEIRKAYPELTSNAAIIELAIELMWLESQDIIKRKEELKKQLNKNKI